MRSFPARPQSGGRSRNSWRVYLPWRRTLFEIGDAVRMPRTLSTPRALKLELILISRRELDIATHRVKQSDAAARQARRGRRVQQHRRGGAHARATRSARAAAARPARRRPRPRAGRRPLPLRAEHEHDAAAVVDRVVGVVARPRRRRSTTARAALASAQEIGQVADPGDRQMLDGARRGLADRRRDLGRAALGQHEPAAPAHSAVRQIAPRFCGSCTWSSATISGAGARQQLVGVGVAERRDLGAHALVTVATRTAARSPRPPPATVGRAAGQPRLARARSWSPTRGCTVRGPRIASRTGLRP